MNTCQGLLQWAFSTTIVERLPSPYSPHSSSKNPSPFGQAGIMLPIPKSVLLIPCLLFLFLAAGPHFHSLESGESSVLVGDAGILLKAQCGDCVIIGTETSSIISACWEAVGSHFRHLHLLFTYPFIWI